MKKKMVRLMVAVMVVALNVNTLTAVAVANDTVSENSAEVKEYALDVDGINSETAVLTADVNDTVGEYGISVRDVEDALKGSAGKNYMDSKIYPVVPTSYWRYDQTYARGEVFRRMCEARMSYPTSTLLGPGTEQDCPVSHAYEYDLWLEKAAMIRALEEAYDAFVDHNRPCGTSWQTVYLENDLPQSPYLQNGNDTSEIAVTGKDAEDIVNKWMHSAGHKETVIADRYYRIGIGVVRINGNIYSVACVADPEIGGVGTGYFTELTTTENTVPKDDNLDTTIRLLPYSTANALNSFYYKDSNDREENLDLRIGDEYDLIEGTEGIGYVVPLFTADQCTDWKSSDEAVVTVDQKGVCKMVGLGRARVVATDPRGEMVAAYFQVNPPKRTGEYYTECSVETAEVGTLIGVKDLTVTYMLDTGEKETEQGMQYYGENYGRYFKVEKEGVNTFTATLNLPLPTEVTFSVVGVKKAGGKDDGSGEGGRKTTYSDEDEDQDGSGKVRYRKQTIDMKVSGKTYKASELKKKAKSFSIGAKAKGKVTYSVKSYPKKGKKYIKVTKNGKVTMRKGAKRGTYKIKVTAGAYRKGNTIYFETTNYVTIKVK